MVKQVKMVRLQVWMRAKVRQLVKKNAEKLNISSGEYIRDAISLKLFGMTYEPPVKKGDKEFKKYE